MLPDKFFLWPYQGDSLEQAIADILPLLAKSGLAGYLRDKDTTPPTVQDELYLRCAGDIAEFIALNCREWNVSPWWILTSMEREQSALTQTVLSESALKAVCGVVNADVGRTTNPGYYGIFAQIVRCVETAAWLLGVESALKWPEYVRTRKSTPRWSVGKAVEIEQDGVQKSFIPLSAGDFMQLQYTPHFKVLQVNEIIARKITPLQFFS